MPTTFVGPTANSWLEEIRTRVHADDTRSKKGTHTAAQEVEIERERSKLLGEALGRLLVALGGVSEQNLTGPQLLLAAEDAISHFGEVYTPDPPEEMRKNRWQPFSKETDDEHECWYMHIVDNYAMTPEGPKTRHFTFELNDENGLVDVVIPITPDEILSLGALFVRIGGDAAEMLRKANS